MSFSDTVENRVLNWVFTAAVVTRPTAWHIAAYTAAPTDAGGGTEVGGNGYARAAATFSVAGSTASNVGNVDFPAATAAWGTITHVGIFDAAVGGTMLAHAALAEAKTIGSGDIFRLLAGTITVSLD